MTEVSIARVPTRPPTWQLTPPCGTCNGCIARGRHRHLLEVVEQELLKAAADLDPKHMRRDQYYARLDDIARRRRTLREKFETDYSHGQCENLEIVPR